VPNHILRIKMAWTGFQGAPGFSNFYFREFADTDAWNPTQAQVDGAAARVTTFAGSIIGNLAVGVQLQVQQDAEVIDAMTGDLVDIKAAAAQAAKTANLTASPYAAASGAVINWRTNVVRNNRRIRGRTFLVPCANSAFENNGTLNSGALSAFSNAATALRDTTGSPDLVVWARPTRVKDPVTGKPTGEVLADGTFGVVTGSNVPDLAAVLRTRRD
jgi:hypothetical protein